MPRDESVLAARWRDDALDYASDHGGRIPVVVAARVARSFSLYPSPSRQANELEFIEDRPRTLVWVALAAYAAVVALAVAGMAALRDRMTVRGDHARPGGTRRARERRRLRRLAVPAAAEVSFVALAGSGCGWIMERRHA